MADGAIGAVKICANPTQKAHHHVNFGVNYMQEGALYWGGHNLVTFPSLVPPLRLCLCNYLVLSKTSLLLYVLRSFICFG